MEISKKVLDVGITKDVIEYLHSKTKLSHYNIKLVNFVKKTYSTFPSSNVLITIQLDMFNEKSNSRQMSLDITEKKLKKIKRNLILDSLGI